MRSNYASLFSAVLTPALLLSGCGLSPDADSPTVAYREAESGESLKVPPDLTEPASSSSLDVPEASGASEGQANEGDGPRLANTVLPEFEGARFVRAGVNAWLELDGASPEAVWDEVQGFLRSQGLSVAEREPALGVIETDWAERHDEPDPGGITGWLTSAVDFLGSDSIRDRYELRLERMATGGTRIFVTHHSAQEVKRNENPKLAADFEWAYGSGNPSLEAEMSRRLLVHLGLTQARAEGIVADTRALAAGATYRRSEDGVAWVRIDDADYRRVFARIGDGLDSINAEVREVRREDLRYAIAWVPPASAREEAGFFDGWFTDEDEPVELEVQLKPREGGVRVIAADDSGTPRSGKVHQALLRALTRALGGDIGEAPVENPEQAVDKPKGTGA